MSRGKEVSQNYFPDTRWSVIRQACGGGDLSEFCKNYWKPIYDYICSCGYKKDVAEEMAQMFFEKLLAKSAEKRFPEKLNGKFRAYMKRSVKNFLTDQWRFKQRKSREGSHVVTDINDELTADYQAAPDVEFDKSWVQSVIAIALSNLRKESESAGNGELFEQVAPLLDGRTRDGEGKELAKKLGMKAGTFRVMLSRSRQRLRQLIEMEIRSTVSSQQEFEEEVGYLFEIWS